MWVLIKLLIEQEFLIFQFVFLTFMTFSKSSHPVAKALNQLKHLNFTKHISTLIKRRATIGTTYLKHLTIRNLCFNILLQAFLADHVLLPALKHIHHLCLKITLLYLKLAYLAMPLGFSHFPLFHHNLRLLYILIFK